MLGQEGLVYVDKQYKADMELYESIKTLTHRVIIENGPSATLISNWKNSMRHTLVGIKEQFFEWITDISQKFVSRLNKIEQSRELSDYSDQDRFITHQLRDLQDKYKRILVIFNTISESRPDQKLEMINTYKKEMLDIEIAVMALDK